MLPKFKRKLFDVAKMDPIDYDFKKPTGRTVSEIRRELVNGYFDRQPNVAGRSLVAMYFGLRKIARYTIKPLLRAVGR